LLLALPALAGCGDSGSGPTDDGLYTGTFPEATGEQTATLTVSGLAREVFLYVPEGLGAQPPLLIALHGTGGGDELGQGYDMGSRFEAMADAHGFVIAAPESRVQPAGDWDQHGPGQKYWETMPEDDPARGSDPDRNPDLLLIRAIIAEATRAYGVDPHRIFVAGFSNGGFFSTHVAVTLRDRIAAFLELSSGLVKCGNTNECTFAGDATTCEELRAAPDYCACDGAEKPVPLPITGRMPPGFLSHGNQDWTVSVAYTCDLAARMQELGHTVQVQIRPGADHEIPDFTDPAVGGPVWEFFAAHPLP
jgi:poly(3-hydroxybutyrate) depolymerase